MVKYTSGRAAAFLGAAAMVLVSVLQLCLAFEVVGKAMPSNYFKEGFRLDYTTLVEVWEWRRSRFGAELAVNFFGGLGFLLVTHSATVFAKLFPVKSGALKAMKNCFIVGSVLPALEFIENLGTLTMAKSISQWSGLDLDQNSYKALEISYILNQSRAIWLFSLPFLFISTGVLLASYMSFTATTIVPLRHAGIGIFVGILGLVVFAMQVVAYTLQGHFLRVFRMIMLVWVAALVVWLGYLGAILGRDHPGFMQNQGRQAILVPGADGDSSLALQEPGSRELQEIRSLDDSE